MATKKEESIEAKLSRIQSKLNAPKGQRNTFGKYNYRSCEDILEALKKPLQDEGCAVLLSDTIVEVGGRIYVEATATLMDGACDPITVTALAREPIQRKGMDESQITGSSSSYARKYALNGMFAIDDCKDADTMDNRESGKGDAMLAEEQFSDQIKPEVQYDITKDFLGKFCKDNGFKPADVNAFIKRNFDGKTITQMKGDAEALYNVVEKVKSEYSPNIGDQIEGAIPGKVVG